MPYHNTLKEEATYVANLGSTAAKDKFHGLYGGILTTWFPASEGYIIDPQGQNRVGKFVVRQAGGHRNPLLIVELKRPAKWNDAGKQEVVQDLTRHVEGQLDLTQNNTIYGVGGIGLHWMVCKMEKSGLHVLGTVLGWDDDISSNQSYDAFKTVAELVYHID